MKLRAARRIPAVTRIAVQPVHLQDRPHRSAKNTPKNLAVITSTTNHKPNVEENAAKVRRVRQATNRSPAAALRSPGKIGAAPDHQKFVVTLHRQENRVRKLQNLKKVLENITEALRNHTEALPNPIEVRRNHTEALRNLIEALRNRIEAHQNLIEAPRNLTEALKNLAVSQNTGPHRRVTREPANLVWLVMLASRLVNISKNEPSTAPMNYARK